MLFKTFSMRTRNVFGFKFVISSVMFFEGPEFFVIYLCNKGLYKKSIKVLRMKQKTSHFKTEKYYILSKKFPLLSVQSFILLKQSLKQLFQASLSILSISS